MKYFVTLQYYGLLSFTKASFIDEFHLSMVLSCQNNNFDVHILIDSLPYYIF